MICIKFYSALNKDVDLGILSEEDAEILAKRKKGKNSSSHTAACFDFFLPVFFCIGKEGSTQTQVVEDVMYIISDEFFSTTPF